MKSEKKTKHLSQFVPRGKGQIISSLPLQHHWVTPDCSALQKFIQYLSSLNNPLFTATWWKLTRLLLHPAAVIRNDSEPIIDSPNNRLNVDYMPNQKKREFLTPLPPIWFETIDAILVVWFILNCTWSWEDNCLGIARQWAFYLKRHTVNFYHLIDRWKFCGMTCCRSSAWKIRGTCRCLANQVVPALATRWQLCTRNTGQANVTNHKWHVFSPL